MTAGRPEIGPTLSAAWRHSRAARAELRAWQDARLRRLVVHAYDVGALLSEAVRPPPAPPAAHPGHRRSGAHPASATRRRCARRARSRPWRAATIPRRCSRCAPAAARVSRSRSGAPGSRTSSSTCCACARSAPSACGIAIGSSRSAWAVARRAAIPSWWAARFARSGSTRGTIVDGLQDPADVAAQLREANPDVLVGLPGMLDRLTAPELADVVRGVRPRLVIVGGEVATPAMRLRIRETFAAPLVETYASHECPLLAWECRHSGDLHTCDDGVLVEVLRDGGAVEPGERGEVVVTNLHAYAMPFIRYRLGDLATRGERCACGAPFAIDRGDPGADDRLLPAARWAVAPSLRDRAPAGLGTEGVDAAVPAGAGAARPGGALRGGRHARPRRPGWRRSRPWCVPFSAPGSSSRYSWWPPFRATQTGKLRPSRSLVHSEYDRVRFAPVEPRAGRRRSRGA